jgi:phosphate transport system substrate-binding protein
MMHSRFLVYAVGFLAALGLTHCGRQRPTPVTIKGSDTMVILGQRWAETYMAANPGALVQVTGGGSGTGIAALINGTTDICQSSRPMKEDEKRQLVQKNGEPPYEVVVAKDGLAIYLNERSSIQELDLERIKGVYTGKITNWSQLGGPDAPITVYGRENSSGTYEYFKEHVLGGDDFAAAVQTLPGTAAVVNAVAQDPNGIGYGGAAYAKGIRECAVKPDPQSPGVLPTAENVNSGRYPITRALFYYMRKPPEGAAKAFLDYTLSPEGQKLVIEVGYFPVR